ncbi:TetR/AcrR family transcriptional regulator [Clostridium thailandense]|uniref:TetR/AcrR family transcriptional regulator n=1 Tax=Clostridium thailandense TaxID=2794346 RepID=A0A949TK69_9CLOT|nr:TetR/AcrR family transcriptional regulator [Clostridium thailandense]MBV7273810.1 TetR/AcrR family transcriptional regulator [Clostridium thailandense]
MDVSLIHRKEGIVLSTIEAINEVGIQNLSTKIIAKHEGVSEGTLFRHFKSKTDIMISVLNHFSQFDDAIIEASRNLALNPIETIKYFVNAYVEYYENYPAITALVQVYDSLLADIELRDKVRDIIEKRSGFMLDTIKKAQAEKLIKQDIDCEDVEDLILGGTRSICLKWRMSKYNFSIKNRTLSMLNMILDQIVFNK